MTEHTSDNQKQLLREVLICAAGVAAGTGIMFGVFALLGKLDGKVLLGGLLGALLTVANYGLMALAVAKASQKAEAGDVKGGQLIMSGSMLGRYIFLIAALVLLAKTGWVQPYAAVIPLLIGHATIYLSELFRKAGERKQ